MSTNAAKVSRHLRRATAAFAPAATLGRTPIRSLPHTISAPGVYCLEQDLHHTSAAVRDAIRIEADDVVLDLCGHALDGSSLSGAGFACGIYAFGRRNITVRNGTVRGFFHGIDLDDVHPPVASAGHVIEGIRADSNTAIGIAAAGQGMVVRNNLVLDTGGNTGFGGADSWGWGIFVTGAGVLVLGNEVDTVMKRGAGSATGIHLHLSFTRDALVVGNRIVHADEGLVFHCGSWGEYRDNLTSAVTVPYSGGTDAGNNN